MFWRKKNKGRKWRRLDGACVSAEKGGSPFNLFLFFQTSGSRQPSQGRPVAPRAAFGDGHPERRRLAPEPALSGGNG